MRKNGDPKRESGGQPEVGGGGERHSTYTHSHTRIYRNMTEGGGASICYAYGGERQRHAMPASACIGMFLYMLCLWGREASAYTEMRAYALPASACISIFLYMLCQWGRETEA